ncbi:MAG: hypothetical protein RBS96_02110 [Dehalococcoidales bacterium]|jgi:hypothetical protein|nr:hypothetical protein [Dehalococcoidales bacterium]
MIAVIKEIPGGFETTVLNDDMTQPSKDEQHAFMTKYASSVLKPVLMTATAGQDSNVVTKMTVSNCGEREGN